MKHLMLTPALFGAVFGGILGAGTAHAADAEFRQKFLAGELGWENVANQATIEGEVNFYYWGGSDLLNIWIDRVATPAMDALGVTLNARRITGTKDAIDLVLAEKGAGQNEGEGSVDVIWLNGENFATLQSQDALFGAFAQSLPNSVHFEWQPDDPRAHANLYDFGVETGLAEMPWSGEQYLCAVNRDRVAVEDTPDNFDDLKTYLEAHPGKFTYVKPPHYLGNTFVQQVLYALNPDETGAAPYQQSAAQITAPELARLITPGMEYLRDIAPLLHGEGTRYPEDEGALDGLFLNGEIDFSCKFGIYAVPTGLATGRYPAAAEPFIFPANAMIKNKNYLAIPSNAPNAAAALVLINWMSSVEAQASKLQATGFPAAIDISRLDDSQQAALTAAAPTLSGITPEELAANAAPDSHASLVNIIEAVWLDYIERGSDTDIQTLVETAYQNLQ